MYRRLLVLLLVLGVGACAEPPYTNIGNEELKALLVQGVPLYDIRLPEEWRETGVLEGSRQVTFLDARGRVLPDFVPRFTAATGRQEPVILICRTGNRTEVLARYLVEKLGYTRVYNVRDGITGWLRDNNPVVRN